MEQELKRWINNDLKLTVKVKEIKDEFANFYLYSEIFYKLSLVSEKDATELFQYKYVQDMSKEAIKHNYENTIKVFKKILKAKDNFEIDQIDHFDLLRRIRQRRKIPPASKQYDPNSAYVQMLKKTINFDDKHLAQSFIRQDQLCGMQPKLEKIERKLQKYKDVRIEHELKTKLEQMEEDRKIQEAQQFERQYEIDKLRNNKMYIQEMKKKSKIEWQKNQEKWKESKQKEQALINHFTQQIKNTILKEQQENMDYFSTNLKYFAENAQRLGIELKHNPDTVKKIEKAKFNPLVCMQKIKENKITNEFARKEKEKRKRKLQVDQERAQEKINKQKNESDMISMFLESNRTELQNATKCWKIQQYEKMVQKIIIEKSDQQKKALSEHIFRMYESQKELQKEIEKKRKEEYKKRKIEYREINLKHRLLKYEKHSDICKEIFDFCLDLTEVTVILRIIILKVCHQKQQEKKELQIEAPFWRHSMQLFLEEKKLIQEKTAQIFDEHQSQMFASSKPVAGKKKEKQLEDQLEKYIKFEEQWNMAEYIYQPKPMLNNNILGDILTVIIDKLHPKVPVLPAPELPSYLSLKLSVIGKPLSGKKTLCGLLKQKYGIEIILPKQILNEAINLAFPPEESEATKKKAAKKPGKKLLEEQKSTDNIELKELGFAAKNSKNESNNNEFSDEIMVRAIVLKIKTLFANKTQEQLQAELYPLKIQFEEKKNQEVQNVPAKKEEPRRKKVGKQAPQQQPKDEAQLSEEQQFKTALVNKQYYFTQGYAICGFPQTQRQAKLLETALTGFVEESARLNPKAEQLKQEVSFLASKSLPLIQSNKLQPSGLDLIINLSVAEEECMRRLEGMRIDPVTQNIYHLQDNPPPTDVKGLIDRLQRPTDPDLQQERAQSIGQLVDQEMPSIAEFYKDFGSDRPRMQAMQTIEEEKKVSENFYAIDKIVSQVLENKHKQYDVLVENEEQNLIAKEKEREVKEQKESKENKDNQKSSSQGSRLALRKEKSKEKSIDSKASSIKRSARKQTHKESMASEEVMSVKEEPLIQLLPDMQEAFDLTNESAGNLLF